MKTSIRESKYSEMCSDTLSVVSVLHYVCLSFINTTNKKEGNHCKSRVIRVKKL